MNNLGLQACPKFHIDPTWLNLSISQENVVPFKHHAYFYEVLEFSRLESNLQKSSTGDPQAVSLLASDFCSKGFSIS